MIHLLAVDVGGGGRLQHHRVGHDGRQEHRGDGGRYLHAETAELHGDDGGAGAHGQVRELDGGGRHDVADAVVVDDLHDLGLLDAGHGLARLVVVHEDDAAARAHRHVRARDDADGEPVSVEHHGLAQRAGHEVLDGLLEQAVLVQHEHVRLGDVLHLLAERGDEVARHRHLVGAALLELVGGRDVALRDHARGDEAPVGAVVVRDHERADVVLAQQPTGLQDGGVMADGEGVGVMTSSTRA